MSVNDVLTPYPHMRALLIDAVRGAGFPSIQFAADMEAAGRALFTGNQHNPEWEWDGVYLSSASEEELQKLYECQCEERWKRSYPCQ